MTIDEQVNLIIKHVKSKFNYDSVQIKKYPNGSYYLTFEYNMSYSEFEKYTGTHEIHPYSHTLLSFIRNYLGIEVNNLFNPPSIHVFSGIKLIFDNEKDENSFFSSLGKSKK